LFARRQPSGRRISWPSRSPEQFLAQGYVRKRYMSNLL
jgi:hypothetical protein